SLVIALHGADAQGNAIDRSAFADATVTVDGTALSAQAAPPTPPMDDAGAGVASDAGASLSVEAGVSVEGQFSFAFSADITGELLSLQFVNDYSASMRDDDLDIVATIHNDILDVLPSAIYEGEATYFSTEVTVKQPFTDDESALRSALERDTSIDRDTTALYDGMGTGLSSLLTRDRPLKLLIVSTDGLENASTEFSKADIVSLLQQNHVAVLMLGAVFSDVGEMQDLAGPYGVFFYTPAYEDLRAAVAQYVESLSNLALLRLPPEYADADEIEISVAGEQVSVDPSP
ncbi:MAG TPA: VWA domain-containing protein, partial [Polyangiaceae bacterium]|nr:VWA domain-containing protein [Polyangiaceae bacterium]